MPKVITSIALTDESTSASDVGLLIKSNSGHQIANNLMDYLAALACKARRGSASVQVKNGDSTSASGTITAASVSVTQASGTVTCASVLANDTVTVQGIVFTAVSGAPTASQFDMSGSDTATAASLKAAINANVTLAAIVSSDNSSGVLTITALKSGTAANAYTLATSNNTRLAKSGTTLSGGAADSVTIGGTVLTACNVSPIAGSEFAVGISNTACAANLAAAINVNTALSPSMSAAGALAVCTITANAGSFGNLISLASNNNTRLAKSGTFLSGGADDSASVSSYSYGI